MKRLKKFVSILLFAAMLIPMFVLPIGVSAAENTVSFPGETILYQEDFEGWTDATVVSFRGGGTNQGGRTEHAFNPWNTQIATTGYNSTQALSPTYGNTGNASRPLYFNIYPTESKGSYHFRFDFRFGTSENSNNTKIALARDAYGNDMITVFNYSTLQTMGMNWYNVNIKVDLDERSWSATATPYDANLSTITASGTNFYQTQPTWIPKTLDFYCESTQMNARTIDTVPLVDNFYYTVENVTLTDADFQVTDANGTAQSDLESVNPESAAKMTIDFGREMDTASLSNITITSGTETVAFDGEMNGTVYTLTPKEPLLYHAVYSVNVNQGVKTSTKVDVTAKSFKFKTETQTVCFKDEIIQYQTDFEDWITTNKLTTVRGSGGENPTTSEFNPWSTKMGEKGKNSDVSLSPVLGRGTFMEKMRFFTVPTPMTGAYHFRFDFRFGTSEGKNTTHGESTYFGSSSISLDSSKANEIGTAVFELTDLQMMGNNWYNIDIKVDVDEKTWSATATPYTTGAQTLTKNGTLPDGFEAKVLCFTCYLDDSSTVASRTIDNVPLVDNFYYTVEVDKTLSLTEEAFKVYGADDQEITERTDIDPQNVKKVVVNFGKDLADNAADYITFKCGNTAVAGDENPENGVYTFVPSGNLKYSSTYKLEIAAGTKTAEGGKVTPIDFSFTTAKKEVSFQNEAILYGTDFEDWTDNTVTAVRGKSPSSHDFQTWTNSIATDGIDSNKALSPVFGTTNLSRKLRFILAPQETTGVYHFRFDFRFGTSEGKQTKDANESGESSISLDRTSNSNDPVTIFGLSDLRTMGANWYNIDIEVDVDNAEWKATATPYNNALQTITNSGALLAGINPTTLCFNSYLDDSSTAASRTIDNVPLVDNFYYTLETAGNDYTAVRIASLTSGDKTVGSIDDCANGKPLTVKIYYANATAEDKDMCLLIVGYDENGAITTLKLSDATQMKKGGYGTLDIASDAISTDTKMVKVILCDGVGTMVPYCEVKTFGSVKNNVTKTTTAPYVADYDFVNETMDLYGAANAKDTVAVTVLKNGYTFEGLANLSEAERQAAVLYTSVETLGTKDTNFAFTIHYDENCVDATTGTADLQARIITNSVNVQNVTLTPVSAKAYKQAVKDINTKAADTSVKDSDFATFVQSVAAKMQFAFVPYSDSEVDGDVLAAFRAHIAATPLSETDAASNISVLKKYLVISGIKDGKTDNVNDYVSALFAADDTLKLCYDNVALTEDIQKYFTAEISKALSGTTSPTTADFDVAWKKALILTTALYGDGSGSLENVLNLYGTVIGINGTASASACRTIIGHEYTVETFVSAYHAALGGSGSGGGSATTKRPSSSGGSYNMSMVEGEQANQPLKLNFMDIDGVDWAVEAILGLADKGILNGKGEGLFKPHETVTREEFVKILIGAMNLADAQYQNHFADVNDDDWFVKYVNIAYEKGIVRGVDAANFGVGTSISRQDMAVMLYNALQYTGSEFGSADETTFEDGGDIADYAKNAVDGMVSIGALNGVSNTRFEPAGEATRAQAATVIYRILDRLQ